MIRDEICRALQDRRLHCRLDSNHLLPDSPDQRPTDILTTILYRQSIWISDAEAGASYLNYLVFPVV